MSSHGKRGMGHIYRWVEDEKSAQEELAGACFESENNAEYDERRGYLAVPIGRYRAHS